MVLAKKKVHNSSLSLVRRLGRRIQAGTKTGMLYDGINLIAQPNSQFLQGNGLDNPLSITANGSTFSYVQDHLGSVRRLTDATGAVTSSYNYSPYGSISSPTTSPANTTNPFGFTDREQDETGLVYMRARYYDPAIERFISDDPMGDAQRYVGGNPLRFTDPLGLVPEDGGPSQSEIDAIDPVGAIFRKPVLFFWPSFGVSSAVSGCATLLQPASQGAINPFKGKTSQIQVSSAAGG
jgi:RHS repeat-associated protein